MRQSWPSLRFNNTSSRSPFSRQRNNQKINWTFVPGVSNFIFSERPLCGFALTPLKNPLLVHKRMVPWKKERSTLYLLSCILKRRPLYMHSASVRASADAWRRKRKKRSRAETNFGRARKRGWRGTRRKGCRKGSVSNHCATIRSNDCSFAALSQGLSPSRRFRAPFFYLPTLFQPFCTLCWLVFLFFYQQTLPVPPLSFFFLVSRVYTISSEGIPIIGEILVVLLLILHAYIHGSGNKKKISIYSSYFVALLMLFIPLVC